MRQAYLRQADNGKWMEAIVDFHFDVATGKDIGVVVEFNIYDEKPYFPKGSIIYEKVKA
ncbi:MAG: hypothetical protein M0R80_13685 [Proteobacteria bacterium]|jgi:hypothetical protein|nr:hypothetical protein [Pseudomonadota bacterium]